MFFIINTTERCNLLCTYCEPQENRRYAKDADYKLSSLNRFLKKMRQLYGNNNIELYGGEPLLNLSMLEELIKKADYEKLCIQTNGLLLDAIPKKLLKYIDALFISIDGPDEITDEYRGEGVYKRVIKNASLLRSNGYRGFVPVRMTVSPGADIYRAVNHFIEECEFCFDAIYWQMNVLFHPDWATRKNEIVTWLREIYNPGITKLVNKWIKVMLEENKLLHIIPFTGIALTLLTERSVGLRCGAASNVFSIDSSGDIYPCPVFIGDYRYKIGNITDKDINLFRFEDLLGNPCVSCDIRYICGGRCLYANAVNLWGAEGFALICETVRHLVDEISKTIPLINGLLENKILSLSDFRKEWIGQFEVIP